MRDWAVGRVQVTTGLLLGEFERTISGKQMRGTIWSSSCSRSMPVTFAARAVGSTACSMQARWAYLSRADGATRVACIVNRRAPGRG
eukprot:scaffold62510_cov99-Phaeocystis_antarctica.AAC.1